MSSVMMKTKKKMVSSPRLDLYPFLSQREIICPMLLHYRHHLKTMSLSHRVQTRVNFTSAWSQRELQHQNYLQSSKMTTPQWLSMDKTPKKVLQKQNYGWFIIDSSTFPSPSSKKCPIKASYLSNWHNARSQLVQHACMERPRKELGDPNKKGKGNRIKL